MKPIAEMTPEEALGIRYVLMDIDDTLTKEGKLLPQSYSALWDLSAAGLKVIPITGRPAGWCDLIAREWPADGVVGENGALAFWEENGILRQDFHPQALRNNHPLLEEIREKALAAFPGLRLAKDQFSRLYDIALDFAEEEPALSLEDASRALVLALEMGAQGKVSSIHVNIWLGDYDKLSMTERFLHRRFGWKAGAGDREILFVGDSPNDEPMFARFPLACAVANIRRYEGMIRDFPTYVAEKPCGEGFAEIVKTLLSLRG